VRENPMFTFNRKEQLALIILSAILLLGVVITFLEGFLDNGLPEFEVRKAAVEVPERSDIKPSKPEPPRIVNINTASAKELQTLPKIGPRTASLIVEHRTGNGPFTSLEELTAAHGIGSKTLERLRPLITVTPP